MKHPWATNSDEAELEALQTDVMRFVAILGLCLAAIFSLVQRASLDQPPPVIEHSIPVQATPEQQIVARGHGTPGITPVPEKETTHTAPAREHRTPETDTAPVPATSQKIGFSLEFASAAALMALLEIGLLQ